MDARILGITVSALVLALGACERDRSAGGIPTENCGDAVDNDGDGTLDCADTECADDVACAVHVPARFGSLVGTVVDTTGDPLANVRVQVGANVTLTDDGGHFVLMNLVVPDDPTLAKFKRSGYGGHTRRVQLLPDRVVQIRVVLKAVDVAVSSQDALAGFTVTVAGDVRVIIPPGSLLDDEGTPIDVPVDVEIVIGDPTDPLDAPAMPGDYLSDEDGGTPLDSVAFLDVTVRTVTGAEVSRVDPDAPVVVEMRIPDTLQESTTPGATIPWWRIDESTGFWRRDGAATVFQGTTGSLWTRANVTSLGWWNCDEPITEHGCVCVDVIDGAGDPIAAAQVVAGGVTYNGTSTPVYTDDTGRACITVKNSVSSPEQVDLFVPVGRAEVPYAGNPVDTPTVVASCLRDIDCPESCDVLTGAITLDRAGLVSGTVTLLSGAPAVGLLVSTDHASSTTTDEAGAYHLPVFLDIPLSVFTIGYTSPELGATATMPEVVHNIELPNLPPLLVDLSVNGVPQALPASPSDSVWWLPVQVDVSDGSAPLVFDALVIDFDGDPIAYAWSGSCSHGGAPTIPCEPSDARTTTCEPLDGCTEIPQGRDGEYVLSFDDGYVAEPVEWEIHVKEWPVVRPGLVHGNVTSLRSGAPAPAGMFVWIEYGSLYSSFTYTDAAGNYSLPVFFDAPFTVSMDGYNSPELLATASAPEIVHDIALDNLPPRLVDLSVNGVPQDISGNAREANWRDFSVPDLSVPVQFDALAIDDDGDPIAYSWSGSCLDTPGPIPLSCTPPDALDTTCDSPVAGCSGTERGRYELSLDDGFIEVWWDFDLSEGP